jgi:hypothetical protein
MRDPEKAAERSRRWRAANPEKVREQRRRHNERYPDQQREAAKRRREANPDRARERERAYYLANADRIREQERTRRQRKGRAPRNTEMDRAAAMQYKHGMSPGDWASMWDAQNGACYLCGAPIDPDQPKLIAVDHDHGCCPRNRSCAGCRRGLTHHTCNTLIGLADDDPVLLRQIADNLELAQGTLQAARKGRPVQYALWLTEEVLLT